MPERLTKEQRSAARALSKHQHQERYEGALDIIGASGRDLHRITAAYKELKAERDTLLTRAEQAWADAKAMRDLREAIGPSFHTQDRAGTAEPIYMVQLRDLAGRWINHLPFLTRAAAEAWIARHGHDFEELRVYVASGNGNREWMAVRAALARARGGA